MRSGRGFRPQSGPSLPLRRYRLGGLPRSVRSMTASSGRSGPVVTTVLSDDGASATCEEASPRASRGRFTASHARSTRVLTVRDRLTATASIRPDAPSACGCDGATTRRLSWRLQNPHQSDLTVKEDEMPTGSAHDRPIRSRSDHAAGEQGGVDRSCDADVVIVRSAASDGAAWVRRSPAPRGVGSVGKAAALQRCRPMTDRRIGLDRHRTSKATTHPMASIPHSAYR